MSAADENVNKIMAKPSAFESRAYAPSSDGRHVLSSIDNRLTEVKSAWKGKNANKNNTSIEEFFDQAELEEIVISEDEQEVENLQSIEPSSAVRKRPHLPPTSIEEESAKLIESMPVKVARDSRFIKYGSLLLLVGQMVGLVMLMRYSRIKRSDDGELYLASTAVCMMELIKFFLCLGVIFYQGECSLEALRLELRTHVWESPYDLMKLCVPSFLYTVQNNLLYVALSNLDAATYQVLYQLKILTTALFSATMLGKRFSASKWVALVVLTSGVAVVEVSGSSDGHISSETNDQNPFVGFVAVLAAACTSGFAGVYFEMILKGSEVTLWIRNIQMGLFSITIAFLTAIVQDSAQISQKGFFTGYSPIVLTVITVQAVGGLIVAVVIKYADNVLKVFASSFSILLSCLVSALAFNFRPNNSFLVGASLVLLSTVMYSHEPSKISRSNRDLLPLVQK